MTYQELVNRIQTIANAHYMIVDFGYGDLSDLKTRFENTSGDSAVQADYPYLFLNPAQHTRTLTTMTYNFNMIIMDMARGEVADQPYNNFLAIQSQCQQYIDDVLAALYYDFKDLPEVIRTNITYAPFKERFQDAVAGMTASLTIEVPQGLNACIAPINKEALNPTATPVPTLSPTPTVEPTPTATVAPTPTATPDIVQYLKVRLQGCSNFDLQLFEDAAFTIPTNAICDYIVNGTAIGDEGTVYTGSQTMATGDHTHTFNLNQVLPQGECVASFTVNSITPQCSGVTIII